MSGRKRGRPKQDDRVRTNLYLKPLVVDKIKSHIDRDTEAMASMGKVIEAKFEGRLP